MVVRICDFILGILIGIPAGAVILIGILLQYASKNNENREPPTKDEWRQE